MGKRELLLIGAFVAIGAIVYSTTAPAPAPGQHGFSLTKLVEGLRREVRGNRASAEVKSLVPVAVKAAVTEVRFETGGAPLTITGEDRPDVLCELQAWSNGYDEEEAKRYAGETVLRTIEAGTSLVIGIKYPEPAAQRASLVVRMPKAMAVRVQPGRARLEIDSVASVELVEARGQVRVRNVAGRAIVTHRGGELTIDTVSALKLNARGSTVAVSNVKAETVMQVQAGELRAKGLAGPVELESNGTRVVLDDLTSTRRPIRINAVGGRITVSGLRSDTRIDGRDTRIDVAVDRPAPIAIYNEADEPIEIALPEAGFNLDALATGGRLTVPKGLIEVTTAEDEQRASGPIGGGGPTLTLRTSRGSITIKKAEPKPDGS
jgi:hypothetical protein